MKESLGVNVIHLLHSIIQGNKQTKKCKWKPNTMAMHFVFIVIYVCNGDHVQHYFKF